MQLQSKININGKIKVLTGLTIGATQEGSEIGGLDNPVIKDSKGIPYIPGSSLKGKLRSLLEISEKNYDPGQEAGPCYCGNCNVCAIFGQGAPTWGDKKEKENKVGPTRVIIRDAKLNNKTKNKMENEDDEFKNLDLVYTETKWENTMDRITSRAKNPNPTERVPAGAYFDFNMIFDIWSEEDKNRLMELIKSMRLLEDDYLGSSGTRGYGRIKFKNIKFTKKEIEKYKINEEPEMIMDVDNLDKIDNGVIEKL